MITFSIIFQEHPNKLLSIFTRVERADDTPKEAEYASQLCEQINPVLEAFMMEKLKGCKTGGMLETKESNSELIEVRVRRLNEG